MSHSQLELIDHVLADGSHFFLGSLPKELEWDTAAFSVVWALHPTEKHRIKIHGREVETPRWQQAYGADYYYTGGINRALPVLRELEPLLHWVQRVVDPRCQGILVNWYEGPRHYIGPHHDSTTGMVRGAPIVTVSYGETRTFRLSRGKGEDRQTRDFSAADGTIFVMPYETNQAWKHEVVKSARYIGRRISVTFRALVQGTETDSGLIH
jgi:alkylated DNA repair dioxygenase AlkB